MTWISSLLRVSWWTTFKAEYIYLQGPCPLRWYPSSPLALFDVSSVHRRLFGDAIWAAWRATDVAYLWACLTVREWMVSWPCSIPRESQALSLPLFPTPCPLLPSGLFLLMVISILNNPFEDLMKTKTLKENAWDQTKVIECRDFSHHLPASQIESSV